MVSFSLAERLSGCIGKRPEDEAVY